MASIRKAKKLGTYKVPKYTKERAKLMADTRKLIEQANKRLKGLNNAGYKGTWASKKLIDRINTKTLKAWDRTGKIKINRMLTNTQLKAIQKATDQFLKSKTSTIKGIRDTESATIKAIQATLSDEKRGLVSKELYLCRYVASLCRTVHYQIFAVSFERSAVSTKSRIQHGGNYGSVPSAPKISVPQNYVGLFGDRLFIHFLADRPYTFEFCTIVRFLRFDIILFYQLIYKR